MIASRRPAPLKKLPTALDPWMVGTGDGGQFTEVNPPRTLVKATGAAEA